MHKNGGDRMPEQDLAETVVCLSKAYLEQFGHYPPVHRTPDALAIELIQNAMKENCPLDPEPFAGSGCNCT